MTAFPINQWLKVAETSSSESTYPFMEKRNLYFAGTKYRPLLESSKVLGRSPLATRLSSLYMSTFAPGTLQSTGISYVLPLMIVAHPEIIANAERSAIFKLVLIVGHQRPCHALLFTALLKPLQRKRYCGYKRLGKIRRDLSLRHICGIFKIPLYVVRGS